MTHLRFSGRFARGAVLGILVLLVACSASVAGDTPKAALFTPGHYTGRTAQRCPANPVPATACSPGERLPIDFTITRRKFHSLTTLVIEDCEELGQVVHTIKYPVKRQGTFKVASTSDMKAEQKHVLFAVSSFFSHHGIVLAKDILFSELRGTAAHGRLVSQVPFDTSGQPAYNGDETCLSPVVPWRARLGP